MGLGYPGGAVIDKLAKEGNPSAINFTRPYMQDTLDFSFSGLKTAVLNWIKGQEGSSSMMGNAHPATANLAASFQEAVVDTLVFKSLLACKKSSINNLVISGGVACNSRLRHELSEAAESEGINLFIPHPKLCTDNGATVAAAAYHKLRNGISSDISLNAYASL